MAELVAVNDIFTLTDLTVFKREALMFDRIAVPNIRKTVDGLLQSHPTAAAIFNDLNWLLEEGIVFDPDVNVDEDQLRKDPEYKKFDEYFFEYVSKMGSFYRGINIGDLILTENDSSGTTITEEGQMLWDSLASLYGLFAREISLRLRLMEKLDAYPVLSSLIPPLENTTNDKSEVLDIVLNNFPTPDETTPWEQIKEFRSDANSWSKFLALKNWINEVARMELPSNEVEDKLAAAMNDYTEHMKQHRMKIRWDTLKTIVSAQAFTGGGFLIGWGKLGVVLGVVKPLFSIKEYRIKLLEAEQTAPGREVAYIIKAKDTF